MCITITNGKLINQIKSPDKDFQRPLTSLLHPLIPDGQILSTGRMTSSLDNSVMQRTNYPLLQLLMMSGCGHRQPLHHFEMFLFSKNDKIWWQTLSFVRIVKQNNWKIRVRMKFVWKISVTRITIKKITTKAKIIENVSGNLEAKNWEEKII